MRIVFIDYVLDPAKPGTSGLSDVVWDIAVPLAEHGHDVHVIAPYTVDKFPSPKVTVHRFPIPFIGYQNIIGHLNIIWQAYKVLCQIENVDIIHTPEYVSAAVITSLYKKAPLVFTEPGNIFDRIRNGNPYDWSTTQVYKIAARRTARKAYLIATSEWMAFWWNWTGIPVERITPVPLGIDAKVFVRVADAKAKLGIPQDVPMLLYAARLSRENGADVSLQAVALLCKEFPNLQLHVLGAGAEQETLKQLARTLGIESNVIWHGWVNFELLNTFYSAADVFVFSGFGGGTPRVMLQAMACGAPVVASQIGGIVDHIDDERTGLLFPPNDAQTMAEQIKRLVSDPGFATKIAANGEEYARTKTDWEILTHRIEAVYDRMKREFERKS